MNEDENKKELPAEPERKKNKRQDMPFLFILLTVCAVFLLFHTIKNYMTIRKNQSEPKVKVVRELETENVNGEAVVKLIAVTEKEETDTMAIGKMEQESETKSETESVQSETENWMEIIFGTVKTGVPPQIQISGLTSSEKEMASFKEASFVKAVSLFLNEKGIRTSRIYFEGHMDCSSEKAVVYSASLDGYKDKRLTVIFYPDYPGQFLFTLEETEEQPVAQTETQAQTEAPQPIVQPQPETQAAETERPYDAAKLSIYSIPKELLNYIDNQYMLQYSLYDYLYKNGYGQIDGATVTGYEIDGDTRTAVINFTLGNGKTVTGTYSKDNSSYSFR